MRLQRARRIGEFEGAAKRIRQQGARATAIVRVNVSSMLEHLPRSVANESHVVVRTAGQSFTDQSQKLCYVIEEIFA